RDVGGLERPKRHALYKSAVAPGGEESTMKTTALLCATFAMAIGFVACDPGSIIGAGAPPATPGINISGPTPRTTVLRAPDNLVWVTFDVSNFTLRKPGTCAGDTACGHVHLKVDGAACNDTAAMKPYNAAGWASPISANLALCPTVEGQHQVLLELHHDD